MAALSLKVLRKDFKVKFKTFLIQEWLSQTSFPATMTVLDALLTRIWYKDLRSGLAEVYLDPTHSSRTTRLVLCMKNTVPKFAVEMLSSIAELKYTSVNS